MALQPLKCFCVVVLLFLSAHVAMNAADVFWDAAVSGDWDDPTKWTGGAVPVPGDDVFIDVAGTYTVTLDDSNRSINSLTVGAGSGTQTLFIHNRTLSLAAASEIGANGFLQMRSANLDGAGTIELKGLTSIMQTCSFDLETTNAAGAIFNVEGTTNGDSELRVEDVFENLGKMQHTVTGTFARTVRLRIQPNDLLINGTGATMNFTFGAQGGSRTVSVESNGELRNFGTINIAQPTTITNTNNADIDNRSTINVTGANLTINQSSGTDLFNSGTFNIGATRQISLTGGRLEHQTGTYSGDGLLFLSSVTINGNTTFEPMCEVTMRGGTVNTDTEISDLLTIINTATFNEPLENATGAIVCILGGTFGDAELRIESRMDNFGLLRLTNETSYVWTNGPAAHD